MKSAVLFTFLFVVGVAAASPVGCEDYNASVFKCWNQGTIENETYISKELIQIANAPDRFSWGHYVDGIVGVDVGGPPKIAWSKFTDSFPNLDANVNTDNESYWDVGVMKTFNYGIWRNALFVNYSQLTYDDYVNITVTWASEIPLNINWDWYVVHCIENIDINNDGRSDVINYDYNENYTFSQWTNDSTPFLELNITGQHLKVGSMNGSNGIDWKYDNDERNGAWWNGSRLCAVDYVGHGSVQGVHSHSFYWIDIPACLETTILGCVIDVRNMIFPNGKVSNSSGLVEFYTQIDTHCNNLFGGCGGLPHYDYGQSCLPSFHWNEGCYMVTYDNTSIVNIGNLSNFMITNNTGQNNPFLQCQDQNYSQCGNDDLETPSHGNTSTASFRCNTAQNYTTISCFHRNSDDCEPQMSTGELLTSQYQIQCGTLYTIEEAAIIAYKPFALFGRLFGDGWLL